MNTLDRTLISKVDMQLARVNSQNLCQIVRRSWKILGRYLLTLPVLKGFFAITGLQLEIEKCTTSHITFLAPKSCKYPFLYVMNNTDDCYRSCTSLTV